MKPLIAATFFVFAVLSLGKAADFTAWKFTQPLPVSTTSLTRSILPSRTLDVARPRLEDLRVLSPLGTETPYLIQWPRLQPARAIDPSTFEMKGMPPHTELTLTAGTNEKIRAIHLKAAAPRFLKSLHVETSPDGSNWTRLVAGALIFRELDGQESLSVRLPEQSHVYLRVVVDDLSTPPVAFTDARLEIADSMPTENPLSAKLIKREEIPGKTRLTLELEGRNLFLSKLQLNTSDPIFNRRVTAWVSSDAHPETKTQRLGSATIFRLTVGDQTSSSLEVPIHQSASARGIIIEIENGDSPPLKIEDISATQHPIQITFQANETGAYRLISGHPLAAAPQYDIATMSEEIFSSPAAMAVVGSLEESLHHTPALPLPDINTRGINIDLADCRFRRAVTVSSPGVIAIELDPEILSHSQNSMADLRLIQSGRQIPFILEYASGPWVRFVEPSVTTETDPKHPTLSRWTVTLPQDSLLVGHLTCTSPSPLFDRIIRARATEKDGHGNERTTQLGTAHWTRKPGDSSSEFRLSFDLPRIPRVFDLESDNGDNPPIELQRLRIHHPTIHLIAKVDATTATHLYYGNDRATAPRYDLKLVANDLRSAPKQSVKLGPEETLTPTPEKEMVSIGSPWLWVALALVVAALLWTMGKMLPPAEAKGQ